MPQTLYSFFQSKGIKDPTGGSNLAGFIHGKEFKYYDSSNLIAPATVNALGAKPKSLKATVYTSRKETLWIKNYPKINVKFMDALTSTEGDGITEVTPVLQTAKKWPRQITALEMNAPLPGGSLYAAEAGAHKDLVLAEGSRTKGLTRVLRYYMLAAYSLVDISAAEGYQGLKNYVGALLVSDEGKILAAGINIGSYRHAEVSMLLSYVRKNSMAAKIPENTIIFSTLTPCKGCTGYLEVAKPAKCVVYFGQEDTGKDGRVGKKISAQLSGKTKEPLGRSKTELPKPVEVETEDIGGDGVVVPGATGSIYKVTIDKGLTSCMGEGSIATQIGKAKDSREILTSASEALIHKMLKNRAAGDEESKVKTAVLQYIGQWLGTSKSAE